MKIIKLELTHFGKFHHKTLSLHDGCNLIYGPNETGKSTIHTFISGMLFGLDPSRGRGTKASLYQRYLPWDTPGEYSGKLWFEKDSCIYRIERCFLKEHRSLQVIDETHGTALEPAAEQLDALLAPVNEVLFRNTLSIRQLQTVPDDELAAQLENYTANLQQTHHTNIDITAALEHLTDQVKILKKTLHPDALEKKMHLEEQLAAAGNDYAVLAAQLDTQEQVLTDLTEQISGYRELIHRQTEPHAVTRIDSVEEQSGTPAKASDVTETWDQAGSPKVSLVPITIAYFFCLFSALAALWATANAAYIAYLPYLLGAGWFFLLLTFILGDLRARKLRFLKKQIALRNIQDNDKQESSARNASETTSADLALEIQDSTKHLTALQQKQETHIRTHAQLQIALRQKKELLFQLESEIGAQNTLLEADAEVNMELQALTLAITRLKQVSEQIQHTYGTDLNRETSGLLERITAGRYSNLVLNESLHITLNTPDRLIPAEQLSRGTLEQIYLCLRIAAARMITKEEPFPFLLDDVFAYYDDSRLLAALKLLKELDTQIILFSCHAREHELMRKLESNS